MNTPIQGTAADILKLADFYSDFTVEYVYTPYAYSKYNALVGYSDGENVKYPIDVRFEGSSIIVGGTEYKDVLKKNGSSNLRFAVNTKSKNYTVIADSVVVAKNVPFACNVSTFNIFRFVSDKEGTAYFKAHPFLLEAGYLLKENFFCESKKGVELYNWDVKGKTNMISDDTDIYDPYHRSLTPGAEMKKSISPQGGVITYETQILFPQKKDGARVAIGCSSGTEIALYTSNGNICYDDGKGGSGVVWENYKPNVWYEYKLEVNIKAHTCKFYVNRCHDNARCESMWARLKEELIYERYDTEKMTIEELKTIIWRYFMSYWNNRRICTANGGLPPMEKRRRYELSVRRAA